MNKAAYNLGIVAALMESGLLKSADANALAEQLRQEPEIPEHPPKPLKRMTVPAYEDDYFTWSGKGNLTNDVLQNLGIDIRGPDADGTY